MKLPEITSGSVSGFELGKLPRPDAAGVGKAQGELIAAIAKTASIIYQQKVESQFSSATGDAAQELSELRAKLEYTNSLPIEEIPGNLEFNKYEVITSGDGEEEEIDRLFVFTHEVADEWWDKQSNEIINKHANTISSKSAREKFVSDMSERYVAPGTLAINKASITRARMHNQAIAQRSIEDIMASTGPSDQREEQVNEVLDRQIAMGTSPMWVEQQRAMIGPKIDLMDARNALMAAKSIDEIDQIEDKAWAGANRMSPSARSTLSVEADKRRVDFKKIITERQIEKAAQVFNNIHDPDLPTPTVEDIGNLVSSGEITREAGHTFVNGLTKGSTTKASDQWTLSRYRGEINRLKYTGGPDNLRITDKAKLLNLIIVHGSMGLTPNGVPTGQPATISGTDAHILGKEIAAAVKAATENESYKDALESLLIWTRSKLDLEGQLTSRFGGNQNQVEAAIAFKMALDGYMNTYGADAKPVEFIEINRDAYDPRNFSSGINGRFLSQVPQVQPYVIQTAKKEYIFDNLNQQNFLLWLSDERRNMEPQEYERISSLFNQYYRGEGIAPNNGALMLEPDDPLYRQFQQMILDNE